MQPTEARGKATRGRCRAGWGGVVVVALWVAAAGEAPGEPAAAGGLAYRMGELARAEVAAGNLGGVSVALVDGDRLVVADGFGWADMKRRTAASADTVYRVGSISKLFTALAVMQCVEEGRLALDEPVNRYVPEFRIVDPFPDSGPITLRQLMCHRSGLVREAPVGGYFDRSEPGARATVASLDGCVLVDRPGARTKYSNSGVTVVGRAVEEVTGRSFGAYQAERVLGPAGMTDSGFVLTRALRRRLAEGRLTVAGADGGFREIPAPRFEFGILPAGNLYSTAEDLARFLSCLFADGRGEGGVVVRPGTLAEMWRVQLAGTTNGFGLGFFLGHHRGWRTVGHMGAVYGFTSSLLAVPEQRVGVVVLANDDLAVGPVRRLARQGLDLLLETRPGTAPPPPPVTGRTDPEELARCVGDYESESYWARVELAAEGGLTAVISRQRFDLRPAGRLVFRANGRLADDADVRFNRGDDGEVREFTALGQAFRRVEPGRATAPPATWGRYVGAYGPAYIPLLVSVRHGHLYAMTENEYDYRLTPRNRTVFAMPPGLYEGEDLVFQVDRSGRVQGVVLANMPLARRR